jgi:hypothetical protein
VLQYIASGLFGMGSFQGGLKTAGIGALLHYFIAFVVGAVYYAASIKLPTLHKYPVKWGLTYGVVVHLVVNYVVLHSLLYPRCNSLTKKKFQTIKCWTCKHSAPQKCLLSLVQDIDGKEFGSPG